MDNGIPKMLNFRGQEYPCCASLTMGIIGGKWKTVILFHLINEKLRYNELTKEMSVLSKIRFKSRLLSSLNK